MINITQGENKTFTVRVVDKNGAPFDLSSFSKFKVCLPLVGGTAHLDVTEVANANGSVVAVLGNPILGALQVTLNFADTAGLNVGTGQDVGLVLNNAGETNPRPRKSEGVLNIYQTVCP